jgi:hypothetical protein
MPEVTSCAPCAATAVNTNVPGSAGQDAFTTLSANLTIPAIGATVVATVGNTDWMAVGGVYFLSDGTDWGHFEATTINSTTSVTLEFLGQEGDAAPAAVIGSGGKVVAGGTQQDITLPLPIADGGTGAASKSAAIAALGVGQTPTVDSGASLAYDVTNSPAQITGMAAAVPTTGTYLILARITVLYTAVTFAASRVLTMSVRNATTASNLVTTTRATLDPTTTDYPSFDYVMPYYTGSLTAGDSIQLFISLDTVESAGSTVVTDASLVLIPIAL